MKKIDIAESFPELAVLTAHWFIQGFSNAISAEVFGPAAFKTEASLKKASNNLFKLFIDQRYAQYPDDNAEEWLNENTSFKYGVMGFILDIVYIEADESSQTVLPMHFHEMPEKLSSVFEILIGEMTHEILKFLVEQEFPDAMIFGEFGASKTFQKKLNKDYSEGISYFAKKYTSDFIEG
tara:strand:- start:753 stop:1292 length:540 start_codon:yes stop_codon:yes gene_type:complete